MENVLLWAILLYLAVWCFSELRLKTRTDWVKILGFSELEPGKHFVDFMLDQKRMSLPISNIQFQILHEAFVKHDKKVMKVRVAKTRVLKKLIVIPVID